MKTKEKAEQLTDTLLQFHSETETPKQQTSIRVIEPSTPAMLLEKAIEKGLGVEQLEKLMDLHERWLDRQAKMEYNAAFSKFQYECQIIQRVGQAAFNTAKGAVKYSHTDLGNIEEIVKEPLYRNGFSYNWKCDPVKNDKGEPENKVRCTLTHISGHSDYCDMQGPDDDTGSKNKIQGRGSAVTYLERYSLLAVLGKGSAEKDTDGKGKNQPQLKGKGPQATADQLKTLLGKISAGTYTIEKALEYASFDESQIKTLEIAQKNAKPKVTDTPTQP